MKKIRVFFRLLLIMLWISITSCEKSEPELPLADQLIGEYVVNAYTINNATLNLPATSNTGITVSAKITCKKVSDEIATFIFVLNQTKSGITTSNNSTLDAVELRKTDSGIIEGYYKGLKEISWQNNKLTLILTDPDPAKAITVLATKSK